MGAYLDAVILVVRAGAAGEPVEGVARQGRELAPRHHVNPVEIVAIDLAVFHP